MVKIGANPRNDYDKNVSTKDNISKCLDPRKCAWNRKIGDAENTFHET